MPLVVRLFSVGEERNLAVCHQGIHLHLLHVELCQISHSFSQNGLSSYSILSPNTEIYKTQKFINSVKVIVVCSTV